MAASAGGAEVVADLAGGVTLQAADDLRLGFSFGRAAPGVGAGGRVRAQAGEHDPPQGMVGCRSPPGQCRWRVTFPDDAGIGAAPQVGPGRLAARPPGVIPGRGEQQGRGAGADPVQGEQPGGMGGHERDDELAEAVRLAAGELCAPPRFAQRDAGGVPGGAAAGAGPRRRQPCCQRRWRMRGEAGPQVIGPGQDQGPGLAVRPGTFSCGAAPVGHQRPGRLDGAVRALGRAAGPAGLRGPGSADRIQRAGPARPAPILPAGTIYPDDPHASRGDTAGQARTATAGPLDPGQAHGAEPAQPARQAGVAGRSAGELLHAGQPPDRIERSGDTHTGAGVHAAGNGPCFFYDGHSHPLSQVEGWHAPAGRRTCEPRPLAQDGADQAGTAGGCRKTCGPAGRSIARQPRGGVSRIGGQAGTQAPDPTPVPGQDRGSRAGSTIHTLPAESVRVWPDDLLAVANGHIYQLWRSSALRREPHLASARFRC